MLLRNEHGIIPLDNIHGDPITLELHLPELYLSGWPIIRIGLALPVNFPTIIQKNYYVFKLPDIGSSTVQCYGF
jgi:hypothetical protein